MLCRRLVLLLAVAVLFISSCCPLGIKALEDNAENWRVYGGKYLEYVDNDPKLNDSRKATRHRAIDEATAQADDLVKAAKGEEIK